MISAAYALEKNAVHPIAKAVIAYAMDKNISPAPLKDFKAIPGSAFKPGSSSNKKIRLHGTSGHISNLTLTSNNSCF